MSARWVWRIALALVTLVCLGLGSWQLVRLQWKLALIARVDARVHAPAQPAPPRAAWASLTAENAEYLHVQASGILQHQRSTLVQASTTLGPGYWVMTPLRLTDGSTILINRGFVPERRLPTAPAEESTSVSGLLRLSETGGGFLRNNDARAERWYSRDVQAIAAARGLGSVAPYFIDAEADPRAAPGAPVGGLTVIAFRNHHLVYALTWFTLAAMVLLRVWQIRRRQATMDEA
ncbi:SURF1 family protein [Massilia sp. TS11]|uniref:SURF1 family protein n=1 Tax=Massilia sp. TS11 TaxID=2908003 RepID=UPI001EDA0BAE|nr:SURF1 family protein [Massilia sp. TS11]MCG2583574.1 SURF1 family protein [Massilia sp. TS11]